MRASAYIGIDIGTTSVKCMAADQNGKQLALSSKAYKSESPYSGWVEQDPEDWIDAVSNTVRDICRRLKDYQIKAVSFSGHMSSPVFLDADNKPLRKCITVADTRSFRQSRYLTENFSEDFARASGNYPYDCFIAAKLLWLKEEELDIYDKTSTFVCAKDYVRYRLTGRLYTDPSDAGNTNFYDYKSGNWSYDLISKAGIRTDIFPAIIKSTDLAGYITGEGSDITGLPEGTPVICGAADMACSQIGTGAVADGCLAITLGTSGQICIKVPDINPVGTGKITYHMGVTKDLMYAMATIFSGGLAANWCYKLLNNKDRMDEEDFKLMGDMAASTANLPPGSGGIIFLPFLTGSASPYFSSQDRSGFTGLSLSSTKLDIMHAVLEGVAYNIYENIKLYKKMGLRINNIRLGGGGAKLPVWGQIIADVIGKDIDVLESFDASALGACVLAGSYENGGLNIIDAGRRIGISDRIYCRKERHSLYKGFLKDYNDFYKAMARIQNRHCSFD